MLRPDDSDQSNLGRQVRRLRSERGLTRQELADKCGVSIDTLNRIERGTVSPSLDTIAKVCDGLRVSLETFFAMMDPREDESAHELCDYLNSLPDQDVTKVKRLFSALFAGADDSADTK